MRQANCLTCGDCAFFGKELWGFRDSNLARCVKDGKKRWVGDFAGDCTRFVERSGFRHRRAALAGGRA